MSSRNCFQKGIFLLGLLIALSVIGYWDEVIALHKSDHRFRVSGFVRDNAGRALPDAGVTLEHKGSQQKKQVKADRWGFYETLFHLHNANLDEEIVITVGAEVKRVPIVFDPEDVVSDRKVEVDFGAPAVASKMGWVYGVAGVVSLFAIGLYFSRQKKTKVKEKRKK
jgi:hypothetical protein